MFDALLVQSFGGPEGHDDVMPFLRNVTRGRGIPDERLEAVAEHYYHFGGVSPINAQNRALIAALEKDFAEHGIELPIYFGNRNWKPYVADAVRTMRDDGVRNALVFATSATSSFSGCRQYRNDLAKASTGRRCGRADADEAAALLRPPRLHRGERRRGALGAGSCCRPKRATTRGSCSPRTPSRRR